MLIDYAKNKMSAVQDMKVYNTTTKTLGGRYSTPSARLVMCSGHFGLRLTMFPPLIACASAQIFSQRGITLRKISVTYFARTRNKMVTATVRSDGFFLLWTGNGKPTRAMHARIFFSLIECQPVSTPTVTA
jgi:hypothetical protein